MRTLAFLLVATTTSLAGLWLRQPVAHACGGCFAPTDAQTAVDAHRMVISLGTEETILWDQIQYTGEPDDFVWVLPVPNADAEVELADPEFFDNLDAFTAPVVSPASYPPYCGDDIGSFGCGGGSYAADSAGVEPDPVTVYSESTVGPYETVTIGSDDPEALQIWLAENGYAVPEATIPIIRHYVQNESVFVVLRLAPGEGVSAMQPVRVRYRSYMSTFPLKMIVAGAKGKLDLALWVIAEQRYEARNYGTLQVNPEALTWDWSDGSHNYDQVFERTVEEGGNRAWVVEYADLLSSIMFPLDITFQEELDLIDRAHVAPVVTRLRTQILVDHIDDDLVLAPAEDPEQVSNFLLAEQDLNYPETTCDDDSGDNTIGCRAGRELRGGGPLATGLLLVGAMLLGFRRRRCGGGRCARRSIG